MMGKDSKGHGSNKHPGAALESMPWGKMTETQKAQAREYKAMQNAKGPALYEGAPSSVTRRVNSQNRAGLQALGNTVKTTPKMRAAAVKITTPADQARMAKKPKK